MKDASEKAGLLPPVTTGRAQCARVYRTQSASFPYAREFGLGTYSRMSRRSQGIALIQSLSIDEGTRQPTAADWLIEQDRKDRARARNRSYGRRRLQPLFRLFPSASF